MRVTQGMISNNMLRNLSNSNSKMDKYMNQLSTGKKITRPSDDPVVAMKGMGYRSEVLQVKQYQRNTNELHSWYDNSDAALDKATQAMQRVRELAVQASNGTYDENERKSIAQEVAQLKEHIVEIANTQVNDKYIFNGSHTDTPLVKDNDTDFDTYVPVEIEVSKGTSLTASINGKDIFEGLVTTLDNFVNQLNSDDSNGINNSIGEISKGIDKIIDTRADLGARMNRLELVESRLSEQETIATKTMSENEDVDYAKTITELITQESIHRAALSAGSRIIQPTLLDFLR
jgi:flagellar hook-associated protein 3 FlgL